MNRGKFIVLEGIDGSGTTTQAARLVEALAALGIDATATCEPSVGVIGKLIRQSLAERQFETAYHFDAVSYALLFSADRLDHCRVEIEPALKAGTWVICDRYVLSTLAYQSQMSEGADALLPWLKELNSKAIIPDICLVLSIDPEIAASRRAKRGGQSERFEQEALQRKLANFYEQADHHLPEYPVKILSGAQEMEDLTSGLLSALSEAGLLPSDRL